MNELNQNQTSSQPRSCNLTSQNSAQTIPKQAVDIVDLANSFDILSNMYRRQLELDAMTSVSEVISTSTYLNIQMNSIFVWGKQDTGAELNTMSLNIYDQLNTKLKGKLEMRPCSDVNIVEYNKESIECMAKVIIQCKHKEVTKNVTFYVRLVNDNNVILGLNFCKQFQLILVHCEEDCDCKEISLDIINNEFPQGLSVPDSTKQTKLPLVNVNTKLQTYNMKAHIMELSPDLFDRIGTIKDVIMNLDINPDAVLVVQPPKKVPQAMIEPLKTELSRMEQLGVIQN